MAASRTASASRSTGWTAKSSRSPTRSSRLEGVHGILVPGGFGERGTPGMIAAVRFARERRVPFLGICFGMQMAVIECARNMAGLPDASSSSEFGPCTTPVVGLLTEWMRGNQSSNAGRRAATSAAPCASAPTPPTARRRLPHQPSVYGATRIRGAPPPPLSRSTSTIAWRAGSHRAALRRPLARRRSARNRRAARPPLVHRRAIPPRTEIQAARPAPALRRLRSSAAMEQSRLV